MLGRIPPILTGTPFTTEFGIACPKEGAQPFPMLPQLVVAVTQVSVEPLSALIPPQGLAQLLTALLGLQHR